MHLFLLVSLKSPSIKSLPGDLALALYSVLNPLSVVLPFQHPLKEIPFHQTRAERLGENGGGAEGGEAVPQVQLRLPLQ